MQICILPPFGYAAPPRWGRIFVLQQIQILPHRGSVTAGDEGGKKNAQWAVGISRLPLF